LKPVFQDSRKTLELNEKHRNKINDILEDDPGKSLENNGNHFFEPEALFT
jgi:hypothetical protein